MSYVDLHAALSDWPYEPDKISVRKILASDGSVRLQMRIEMGILQMEAENRPDGEKPRGCHTLVEYFQQRLHKHQERNGTTLGFGLSRDDCHELRQEASLYYRRYVAFFVLEEYGSVHRDTSHSLLLFDLCRDYALEQEDRLALEEFRPYVLMMDARAQAYQASEDGQIASALAHVNRGIMHVKAHYETFHHPEAIHVSEELKILRALARELGSQVPKDSLIVTRKALRDAIEQERFEDAARLRDELKNRYQKDMTG
ncbi:MAG: UvrB/UvrC motif-containing protein [Phycisphaerae bacterium]|jgi:hypothetical protein